MTWLTHCSPLVFAVARKPLQLFSAPSSLRNQCVQEICTMGGIINPDYLTTHLFMGWYILWFYSSFSRTTPQPVFSRPPAGPIPSELGNLSALKELYLWKNELSGESAHDDWMRARKDGFDLNFDREKTPRNTCASNSNSPLSWFSERPCLLRATSFKSSGVMEPARIGQEKIICHLPRWIFIYYYRACRHHPDGAGKARSPQDAIPQWKPVVRWGKFIQIFSWNLNTISQQLAGDPGGWVASLLFPATSQCRRIKTKMKEKVKARSFGRPSWGNNYLSRAVCSRCPNKCRCRVSSTGAPEKSQCRHSTPDGSTLYLAVDLPWTAADVGALKGMKRIIRHGKHTFWLPAREGRNSLTDSSRKTPTGKSMARGTSRSDRSSAANECPA